MDEPYIRTSASEWLEVMKTFSVPIFCSILKMNPEDVKCISGNGFASLTFKNSHNEAMTISYDDGTGTGHELVSHD